MAAATTVVGVAAGKIVVDGPDSTYGEAYARIMKEWGKPIFKGTTEWGDSKYSTVKEMWDDNYLINALERNGIKVNRDLWYLD